MHRFALAETAQETFIVRTSDLLIGERLFITGDYEFGKVMAALDLIGRIPALLIDVGANIGTVCIPAVNRGLFRSAVAIEPVPGNVALLRANVALNGLSDKIAIHQVACGASDGATVEMELSPTNHGDHRIRTTDAAGKYGEDQWPTMAVPLMSLDTLCPQADMLIWMDTQGFEGFVLAGAKRILSERPPVVAEFWPYAMRRTGSLEAFIEATAHYTKFTDLDSGTNYPMSRIRDFWREAYGPDWMSYTDILIQ
ncbi:MAG: FkbM family methyltransferase [Sphingomicrobium sp.]